MKIIKNILFPTQFTRYSIDILEYAILFARSLHARLHLLHVITRDEAPNFEALNEFFLAISENTENIVTRTALNQVDLIKVHLKDADIWRGVVRYAHESEIDLVMMAARSPETSEDKSLSHTALSVLEHAPCPVMVIRLPEERRHHQSRFELSLQEMKRELASRQK